MGKKGYNDNVIESLRKKYNDNVIERKSNLKDRALKVDNIADHLVSKFQAPGSRNFFCKCAWNLSEDEIWTAYEQAHGPKIKAPLKYFITVCQIKMAH